MSDDYNEAELANDRIIILEDRIHRDKQHCAALRAALLAVAEAYEQMQLCRCAACNCTGNLLAACANARVELEGK